MEPSGSVPCGPALHKIVGAEVSFLSSGHSHEDIDAMFNLLRAHLEANKELWTPKDFRSCLEKFFENPGARPYEPLRSVILMTRFKDWKLNAHSHVIFSGFHPLKFGLSWKTMCTSGFVLYMVVLFHHTCSLICPQLQEELAVASFWVCPADRCGGPWSAPCHAAGTNWIFRTHQLMPIQIFPIYVAQIFNLSHWTSPL